MKKLAMIMAVLAVAGFAATAQATLTEMSTEGDGLKLEVFVNQLGNGTWEYQYDIHGKFTREYQWYTPFNMQFDFNDGNASTVEDNFLNMYYDAARSQLELHEYWAANGNTGQTGDSRRTGYQPSYGDLVTDTWIILPGVPQANAEDWEVDYTYATDEGFANPFHLPSDYAIDSDNPVASSDPNSKYYAKGWMTFGMRYGTQADIDGDGNEDDLDLANGLYPGPGYVWYGEPQSSFELMATIRIVSDLGPNGTVFLQHYTGGTRNTSAIMAPGVPEPATMSLLALGGLAVLVRRRRK